jgi:N-acetyl-gamma-glutamyl-phosphate reductase
MEAKAMGKIKVGIIGANGYSGVELIRLLLSHPFVELEMVISHSTTGMNIREVYPHLTGIYEKPLEQLDVREVTERVDLLFFATPSGVSTNLLPKFVEKGVICIDLSGDFRLKEAALYKEWYNFDIHPSPLLDQAVYGLTEMNRERVKKAKLIANPGCYPTATLLGLLPALRLNVVEPTSLIIDGKSGVSGAGRKANLATHFGETNENLKIYKVGSHQHVPEIEQAIQEILGKAIPITFSTHLVPMTRGIMCTIYANLTEHHINNSTEAILEMYRSFYQNDPFIRIRELDVFPATKEVYGSNYCDIGLHVDQRTQRLTIVSVIDNVVKGAAGQAIQNMNVLYGFDETTGLAFSPVYP